MKKLTLLVLFTAINTVLYAQSNAFVQQLENAYHSQQFHKQEAVSFDIDLSFGGKNSLKGQIVSATNSSWIKFVKADGTTILFDGKKVWVSPASANNSKARFDIFTWQYFFLSAFKFADEGAHWQTLGKTKYQEGQLLPAARLSFASGTGDASGDYYIVYKNQQNLIQAMGYIVTFGGKTVAQAEKNAHAIVYGNYIKVNGISFAQQWTFCHWSKTEGIGAKIGTAKISNIKFVKKKSIDLQKPDGAVEVKL